MQCEPAVVHPVVVERGERVVRLGITRPGGDGHERLVEQGRDAEPRRERHRIEGAPLLVPERLADAEVVEGGRCLEARGDRAVVGHRDRPGERRTTVSKNALPSEFTRAGPLNRRNSMTGRSATASSSSVSVGSRCSAHWIVFQPPIAVMNAPSGTSPRARRAATISWTSAIEVASSRSATW
jgi:hypothetical protein